MGDRRWYRSVSSLTIAAALLAVGSAYVGCSSPGEEEEVGVVQVAITQVPVDVRCIRVTAQGPSRTATQLFDVMPGEASLLRMTGVPTGAVQFTGEAFPDACPAVGPQTVASWSSYSASAVVSAGAVVDVSLVMRRNGNARVSVDFQDDAPMCIPDGAMCLGSSQRCCSAASVCGPEGVCRPVMCRPPGVPCTQPTDCCPGFLCTPLPGTPQLICQPPQPPQPTCTDGVRNGNESDVDCGGGMCAPCGPGRVCRASVDCLPGTSCLNGLCAPVRCVLPGSVCDPILGVTCCSGQPCMAPGQLCL